MKLGNGLWETRDHRTPGIATTFMLGTSSGSSGIMGLDYSYSGSINNGNLTGHVIRQPGKTWTQSFTYDPLNRLSTASETSGFSRTYGYDRYGNRWVSASSGIANLDTHEPISSSNFSTSTNRINVASSTFNDAGNQTFYTPFTLTYDAENRLISMSSASDGNASFLYDGEGRRVKKAWTPNGGSTVTTYYVYDATGSVAAEYSDKTPGTAGTSYAFTDMLGSVRGVTNSSGTLVECYDYLPFGRMLSSSDNGRNSGCYPSTPDSGVSSLLPNKFTGKERDGEIPWPLDFFGARYMSAAQGRFVSPDPLLNSGRPDSPQSWNRYTYVSNNPLRYTDPLGLYIWDSSLGGDTTDDEVRKNYAKKQANQIINRRSDIRSALTAGSKISDPGVRAAIAAYGAEGQSNGVAVAAGKLSGRTAAETGPGSPPILVSADAQSASANVIVTFDFGKLNNAADLIINAAHEGQHVLDRQTFVGTTLTDPNAFSGPLNLTTYQTEVNAYTTGTAAFRALNPNAGYSVGGYLLWNPGWAGVDRRALDRMLAVPKPKGSYGVTPQNPGSILYSK